jgi:excisionase family DNA binding protein
MDNTHPSPPMLTAQQVAAHLRVSDRKFEQMVHDSDAPPFIRIGRLRRWRPCDVDAWVNARSTAQTK